MPCSSTDRVLVLKIQGHTKGEPLASQLANQLADEEAVAILEIT